MINPELLGPLIGGLSTVCIAIVGWVWRVGNSVNTQHVQLGICRSDVAKLQTDTQHLRDQSVRHDTLVQTVMTQLAKLDKVDQLVSSVEVMRAVMERLERRVDRHPEDSVNR